MEGEAVSYKDVGHGWVRPIPMGVQARCGGPGLCAECKEELLLLTEAVRHLCNWQSYPGDNFHNLLFILFQKGSGGNRERLSLGFPWEYEAWCQWQEAKDPDVFFAKFGTNRPGRAPKSSPTKSAGQE
jgi:hypothetical protein